MSYTWGYIKGAVLVNLQIDEPEAYELGHLNRLPYAANEMLSQVATSIKPKQSRYKCQVATPDYKEWLISQGEDVTDILLTDTDVTMPVDFLEFGDDLNWLTEVHYDRLSSLTWINERTEAHDDVVEFIPHNQVRFLKQGFYDLSYNAYWPLISANTDNNFVLPWPRDISECLPAYLTYKCFKLDNEEKALIWRNEFEIMLARVAKANYQNTRTFKIGGGW